MKTKTALIIACALTAGALVASLALYPALPDRIPTHWNLHGVADGWSSKTTGAFVAAAFMLLVVAFIAAAEWLSPLNYKIEPFRGTFNYIMVICAAMMLYIHAVLLATSLGVRIDSGRWLIAGIFVFFALIGNLLGKTRRNFWVGFRTPWTLASEAVWTATHRLAARLLVAVSLLGAVGVGMGVPTEICFVGLMVSLLVPVLYSFWLSKRLERVHAPADNTQA